MRRAKHATIHLNGNLTGTADLVSFEAGDGIVEVTLSDGGKLEAPCSAFLMRGDGSYELPISPHTVGVEDRDGRESVIPIVAEEAFVSKKKIETGRVRVHKTVREHRETIDEPLFREEVEIRRVAVDRLWDGQVGPRQEGDALIVPILEEVLVVSKSVRVREELHITRKRIVSRDPRDVSLRVEEAAVERLPTSGNPEAV